jgi:DNA helicase-2/ATP-dependent DNA helicase PcrA
MLSATPPAPAARCLSEVIRLTGYREYMEATLPLERRDRLENLDQLVRAAEEFDAEDPEGGFRGFLEKVALISDTDRWDPALARVSLMTLHTAKGLEFSDVFIIGLEERLIPHILSMDSDQEIEEERRILYVGMTRAKKKLYFTWARYRTVYGGQEPRCPSQFLEEISREHVTGFRTPEDPFEALSGQAVLSRNEGAADDFREGDRVEHDVFGPGRILTLSGRGFLRRARVYFDRHGEKELVMHYANLRKP